MQIFIEHLYVFYKNEFGKGGSLYGKQENRSRFVFLVETCVWFDVSKT